MKDQSLTVNNTAIQTFTNDNLHVHIRAYRDENGDIWFVAKDVATALGYANPADAIKRHCKGVVKHYPLQTAGGTQKVRVIKTGDVLRLVANSKLPKAQEIESWIFDDMAPHVIYTGFYMTESFKRNLLNNPRVVGEMFLKLADEEDRRKKAEKQIEADKPYTELGKALAIPDGCVSMALFSKILTQAGYPIGRNTLFKQLREKHYLLKQGDNWNTPSKNATDKHLFFVTRKKFETPKGLKARPVTLVTVQGQIFFISLFTGKTITEQQLQEITERVNSND